MARIIQDEFVKNLLNYLFERPAKEVISAIIALQNLPKAPEPESPNKEGEKS